MFTVPVLLTSTARSTLLWKKYTNPFELETDEIVEERSPVLGADRVGPLAVLLILQHLRKVLRIEFLDPVPRVGEEDLATLDREGRGAALSTAVTVEGIEASRGGMRVVVAIGEDGNILRTCPDRGQQPDEDTDWHLLADER